MLKRTGDIGYFRIVSESSVGAGIRRVVAKTGRWAVEDAFNEKRLLIDTARLLGVSTEDIPKAIQKLMEEIKEKEKEIARLKEKLWAGGTALFDIKKESLGPIYFYFGLLEDVDPKDMLVLADNIRNKDNKAIVSLLSKRGDKVSSLIALSRALTGQISAKDLMNIFSEHLGGGGGGRDDLVQGGVNTLEGLQTALEALKSVIIDRFKEVKG